MERRCCGAGIVGKTDPAITALLAEVETGRPVRVPLLEGQSARSLCTAISRAARSRGLSVETVEGEGFVAVRKVDEPRTRTGRPASSPEGPRRFGRPHPRGSAPRGREATTPSSGDRTPASFADTPYAVIKYIEQTGLVV